MPFYIVFMYERGLNFTEIAITQSVYYFLFLIFELPTGILADKIGRKNTIILGVITKFTALIISVFSFSLIPFIFAEILFSLARALESGTGSAFLYDSLLYVKQENNYKKIQGKAYSMHLIGNTLGGIFGALIAYFSAISNIYILSAFMAVGAFFVAISFKEKIPQPEYADILSQELKTCSGHLFSSIKDVIKSRLIIWIILYSSLVFVLIRANLISLQQPFLLFLLMPKFIFGLVDIVISLGGALFSYFAESIEKYFGFGKTLILIPCTLFISFLGMGIFQSKFALLFLFLQMIAVGINVPIIRDFLQKQIKDSRKRATILSIESLIARGSFAFFALLLGFILDNYGVQNACLLTAGLASMGMFLLFLFRPVR